MLMKKNFFEDRFYFNSEEQANTFVELVKDFSHIEFQVDQGQEAAGKAVAFVVSVVSDPDALEYEVSRFYNYMQNCYEAVINNETEHSFNGYVVNGTAGGGGRKMNAETSSSGKEGEAEPAAEDQETISFQDLKKKLTSEELISAIESVLTPDGKKRLAQSIADYYKVD